MSLFHLLNQGVAVDVVGREPVAGGFHAEGGGEMGFANAGRPEEYDILSVFKKPHGSQLLNLALINGGLKAEVELGKALFHGESGHLNLLFNRPAVPVLCLIGKNVIQNLHDICVLFQRPFEVVVQNLKGGFHFQPFEIFTQPLVGELTHPATSS